LIPQPAFSTLPAFILFLFFILKKKNFWGITQNWIMTGSIKDWFQIDGTILALHRLGNRRGDDERDLEAFWS